MWKRWTELCLLRLSSPARGRMQRKNKDWDTDTEAKRMPLSLRCAMVRQGADIVPVKRNSSRTILPQWLHSREGGCHPSTHTGYTHTTTLLLLWVPRGPGSFCQEHLRPREERKNIWTSFLLCGQSHHLPPPRRTAGRHPQTLRAQRLTVWARKPGRLGLDSSSVPF